MADVAHPTEPYASPTRGPGRDGLYSVAAIDLATFIGSIVAGSILVAANFRKLGDPDSARNAIAMGLVGFAGLIAVALAIPAAEEVPDVLFVIPQLAVAHWYATSRQGETLARHRESDGFFYSKWRAAGIGVLTGVPLFGVIVLGQILTQTKVTLGPGHEVYYGKGANEEEAQKLGLYLIEVGFFEEGHPATVELGRGPEAVLVSFVVNKGVDRDPSAIRWFHSIRDGISAEVFDGEPIELRLCDSFLKPQRVIAADEQIRLAFGPEQVIFYEEGASEDDARGLVDFLRQRGLMGETQPLTLRIVRTGNQIVVGIVVREGVWDNREAIDAFRDLRTQIASNLFTGEAVEVHLCDDALEARRVLGPEGGAR